MNKEMPKDPPQPEQALDTGMDQYAQWLKDHPQETLAPADMRECGPEIVEFEKLVDAFEAQHSLAELHSIIDLTPDHVTQYPLRESAKAALIPIVAKLNVLEKETNILPEKLTELKARYMRLSQAVGFIKSNKVHHEW